MNKKAADTKDSLSKRLASASRAMLTQQIGFSVGCLRINGLLTRLRPFAVLNYPVFQEYYRATMDLPIGTPRLQWDRKALLAKDKALEKIDSKFRLKVTEACFDILDRLQDGQSDE